MVMFYLISPSQFATGHLDFEFVNPAAHIWWEGRFLFCLFKDKFILIIPNEKQKNKPKKTPTKTRQKKKKIR